MRRPRLPRARWWPGRWRTKDEPGSQEGAGGAPRGTRGGRAAEPPGRGSPTPASRPSPTARRDRRRQGRKRTHAAFSHGAMHRAWRSVRANGGGPGVDGQDIAAFEADLRHELGRLRAELIDGSYRPRGVRRVFVPKPKEGLRPLAIWSLRDRIAQRAVHDHLEPHFEERFLDCSHGFRPGRSVRSAVRDVTMARDEGLRWVLDADIEQCFERIEAERLMDMLRQEIRDRHVLRLVQRWLAAEILDRQGRRLPAGAAQGGPLAPLLCNVYLHAFDVALTRRGVRLVRYADDFLCLAHKRDEAQRIRALAARELTALGLRLHPRKTRIVHFDEGFPFLGVFFLRREHYDLG